MNSLTGLSAPGHAAAIPVHYACAQASRSALTVALLLSLGAHLGILFSVTPTRKPPTVKPAEDTSYVPIIFFKPDDVAEPDPVPADAATPVVDGPILPVLVDTPTMARPDEFVQPLDLSSLHPRPDTAALMAIPAGFTRNAKPGSGEPVFNLVDLERTPVVIAQPPPPYPHALRREALTATVVVGFIVDTAGAVVNAHVVDSTHPGFNDAAINGVSKWKFRAGMRAGRKVSTRMHVPIVFRIAE